MAQDIDFQLETAFQRTEDGVVKPEERREMNRHKCKEYSMFTFSTLKKRKNVVRQLILCLGQGKEKWKDSMLIYLKSHSDITSPFQDYVNIIVCCGSSLMFKKKRLPSFQIQRN